MANTHKPKSKEVTRRDFLKGMGGGAIGTAVAPKFFIKEKFIQTKEGKIPILNKKQITLTVNEKAYTITVEPQELLLDVLRDRLNLTGAKKICDRGECGGCTVLLEGKPVYSCMYLAIRADGKKITTIEGLTAEGKLHPVQEAFIAEDAYQCGFCTPGFILSSVALLDINHNPSTEEIKLGLSGNLCRCGNYTEICKAVSSAAKKMKGV
jgi:xanthine dehydrogenase YagT iron-sulfur-binding subunit